MGLGFLFFIGLLIWGYVQSKADEKRLKEEKSTCERSALDEISKRENISARNPSLKKVMDGNIKNLREILINLRKDDISESDLEKLSRKILEFKKASDFLENKIERENEINNNNKAALQAVRDQVFHESPVEFKIGRHAKETLALRYGSIISGNKVNLKKIRPSGMYDARSGKENIEKNCYLVELSDLRSRRALVVIEKGDDFVKTFLPMEKEWFDINKDLETILKGNSSFEISKIAEC